MPETAPSLDPLFNEAHVTERATYQRRGCGRTLHERMQRRWETGGRSCEVEIENRAKETVGLLAEMVARFQS